MFVLPWAKTLLLAGAVFIPVERLAAERPAQPIFRRGWTTDALTGLINGVLLYGVVLLAVARVDALAGVAMPSARRWASGLPIAGQVAVAVALGDLAVYLAHRLTHAIPWLWRFHALHHSAEEMDWLVGIRFHPVDQLVLRLASVAPMVALNVGAEAMAGFVAIFGWQAWLTHANVRISFGPLRWVLVSPEFHHWHHCTDRAAHNRNYANVLACWDLLFGTIYLPAGRRPTRYGIDEAVPTSLIGRFFYPFRREPSPQGQDATEVMPSR
jgi:sterol desaturase/sphingolipid hydroxylase (fatty acid hydroxylase superfamily)